MIKRYGILNEESGKVPHPTTILVDADGQVRYVRTDVNYTKRPPMPELLDALDALDALDDAPDGDGG